jgi:hypothetical protein
MDNSFFITPSAMSTDTPLTLATLPAEVITSIAENLRATAKDVHDFTPRIPYVCPCLPPTPTRQLEALVRSAGCYEDAALAFGMVSKRLRGIAFDQRPGRSVTIGICGHAEREILGMSQVLKNNIE